MAPILCVPLIPLHPTPSPHPTLRQPLTRSALTQLRSEAKQMEVRIGIVNHTLVAHACARTLPARTNSELCKNPSSPRQPSTRTLTFAPTFLPAFTPTPTNIPAATPTPCSPAPPPHQVSKRMKSDLAKRAAASVPRNKHINNHDAYISDDDLADY